MKYRTKNEPIEAIQLTRDNLEEVKSFAKGHAVVMTTERRPDGECYCFISNNSICDIKVPEYGYIIKTKDDNLMFLNQHYFEKTYEKVEE